LKLTKLYKAKQNGAKWEKGEILLTFCPDPYFLADHLKLTYRFKSFIIGLLRTIFISYRWRSYL